jgi:hypothetical protein
VISALDIDLGLITRYSEIILLVALDGSFLNKASDGEGAALLVPNSAAGLEPAPREFLKHLGGSNTSNL